MLQKDAHAARMSFDSSFMKTPPSEIVEHTISDDSDGNCARTQTDFQKPSSEAHNQPKTTVISSAGNTLVKNGGSSAENAESAKLISSVPQLTQVIQSDSINKIEEVKKEKEIELREKVQEEKNDAAMNPRTSSFFKTLSFADFVATLQDPIKVKLLTQNKTFLKFPVSMTQPSTRTSLPVKQDPNTKLNIWKLIKDNLGKDLSKISMPVIVNEPLSNTQKLIEFMEYADRLKKAASCQDEFLRLGYVMACSFLQNASCINRVKKPFNPLLGETYELITEDYTVISEQITHHPPITAYHIEAPEYQVDGNLLVIISFGIMGSTILLKGPHHVFLKPFGEKYSFKRQSGSLHNIMWGKMFTWFEGDAVMTNLNTGSKATITFLPKSNDADKNYMITGTITDAKGNVQYKLAGRWDKELKAINPKTNQEILLGSANPITPGSEMEFYFTQFDKNLNNLTPKMITELPITDSRFRPDNRAYENADVALADEEKVRLEESQRARRKKLTQPWKPLWFNIKEVNDMIISEYNGNYWKCRNKGEWPSHLPDIYS